MRPPPLPKTLPSQSKPRQLGSVTIHRIPLATPASGTAQVANWLKLGQGFLKISDRAATLAHFGKGIEVAAILPALVREMFAEKGRNDSGISQIWRYHD